MSCPTMKSPSSKVISTSHLPPLIRRRASAPNLHRNPTMDFYGLDLLPFVCCAFAAVSVALHS